VFLPLCKLRQAFPRVHHTYFRTRRIGRREYTRLLTQQGVCRGFLLAYKRLPGLLHGGELHLLGDESVLALDRLDTLAFTGLLLRCDMI
jgi:hypothetical protein